MKKLKRWQKIILALFVLGLAACVWEFFSSQNPWLLSFKRSVKYEVLHLSPENTAHELGGLCDRTEVAATERRPMHWISPPTARRCITTWSMISPVL